MKNGRAFEFGDLTVLLGLDLSEPADQVGIEAIDDILARRRATISAGDRRYRNRATLRLVPDTSS
jgi:hypothetical protein